MLKAERKARKYGDGAVHSMFSSIDACPAQAAIATMTWNSCAAWLLSSVLRSPVKRQQLITQWVHAARILLETMP